MDDIIPNLHNHNWDSIQQYIVNNKIDWDYLVDQTNATIHYLAYKGKMDLIKLIDSNTLSDIITQPNIEGDTVAHIAARLGDINLLNFSISISPKIIYQKNRLAATPLFYLVAEPNIVREIVRSIVVADHYLNSEYTLIEYYILAKDLPMVSFLLSNIILNELTESAFFTAIQSDNTADNKIKILQMLLERGININCVNQQFLSPLIVSIYGQNNYDITRFLLESGADPNYYGPINSDHPLTISIIKSDIPTIKLLLKYGIKVDICDRYLRTPMHYLYLGANEISTKIKHKLLNNLENINMADNKMDSVLNLLVHNDNWKMYQDILVDRKLKIYLQNKDNHRPIDGINPSDMDDFLGMVYRSYLNQLGSDIEWVDEIDTKVSLALEKGENIGHYKKYLMDKIIKGQSYPFKKQSDQMIRLIIPPKTNITHFSSYTYNYICFLYYIMDKYPQIKIPCQAENQSSHSKNLYRELTGPYVEKTSDNAIFRSIIKDYLNHSPALINHVIIWKNPKKYFISPYMMAAIDRTLKNYSDTRFILLKITIITDTNSNHANMIIYDVVDSSVERFDPYGSVPFYYSKQIDEMLKELFKSRPHARYLSPRELTDGASFQTIADESNKINYAENDPSGFCVAWCLWYVEMRFKNLKINPESLIKRTIYQINKSEDKFKDYIRDYSSYLDFEKNNILDKAGVPKKYWYKLHIPYDIYKKYLKYIRKIYFNILSH